MDQHFYRNYFKLATPIVLHGILVAAVGVSDAFMLGRVGSDAMSAAALAGQINVLYMNLLNALAVGTSALASQYWGNNDKGAVRRVMHLSFQASGVLGILFFAATFIWSEAIMTMFTDNETLLDLGASYLRLTSFANLTMSFSQVYMIVMKNTGKASLSSGIGICVVVLNIILNEVLIFGHLGFPAMGIDGAAIGTTASRLVELAIVLVLCHRNGPLKVSLREIFRKYTALRVKFIRYSFPVVLQMGSWTLGNMALVSIIGHLGNDVVAAYAVTMIVYNLVGSASDGIAAATSIQIGHLLGNNELEQAKAIAKKSILLSLWAGIAMGLLIYLLKPVIFLMNTNLTPASQSYLDLMLIVMSVKCIGRSLMTNTTKGLLCTGGDLRFLIILDSVNMWCVIVPLGLLATYVLELPVWAIFILINLDEFTKLYPQMKHVFKWPWVKNLTKKEWAEPGKHAAEVQSQILMQVPVGVLVIGSYGKIIYCNREAEALLDISSEAMSGENMMQLFMKEGVNDQLANVLLNGLNHQQQIQETTVHYQKGSLSRDLNVSALLIEEEDLRIGICALLRPASGAVPSSVQNVPSPARQAVLQA